MQPENEWVTGGTGGSLIVFDSCIYYYYYYYYYYWVSEHCIGKEGNGYLKRKEEETNEEVG